MNKYIKRIFLIILVITLCVCSFFMGTRYGGFESFTEGNLDINRISKNIVGLENLIDRYFLFDQDQKKMEDGIYKGMLLSLDDPYSQYYNEEEYQALMEDTNGEFAGIGIYVDGSGQYLKVVSPIEGSPADKAGILVADEIIAVDGKSYTGEEMDEAVKKMRGEVGTSVKLTIRRKKDDKFETFDLDIVRDNIKIATVFSQKIDDKIGYIRISQFDTPTFDDFKASYKSLKDGGMEKLIIDLRNNPGGLLDVVTNIANMFMDKGVIVSQVTKDGQETTIEADDEFDDLPIAVLINEGSASASEILAGALKDSKRAKIVGMNSFGKGIVQRLIPLTDEKNPPGIKLTISEYFTPSKVKIHGKGIKPDYEVKLDLDTLMGPDNLKDDKQLQKAIEILK